LKYSACIELLFSEVSFIERIKMAKKSGFDAVEFWLWKTKDIELIKKECKKNDIKVSIFQGNVDGRMIDPYDNQKYIRGVKESLEKALELDCHNLFLMTDILKDDRTVEPPPYEISEKDKENNIIDILSKLNPLAKKYGVTLLIEPLNTIVDHKGYYLEYSKDGFNLLKNIDNSNIKLLYDIYHIQIMEGNIIKTLEDNINLIGYIHIADVPGRYEPGTGEINYKNIFNKLKVLDFSGYIGFEYIPSKSTEESLITVKEIFDFK